MNQTPLVSLDKNCGHVQMSVLELRAFLGIMLLSGLSVPSLKIQVEVNTVMGINLATFTYILHILPKKHWSYRLCPIAP